MASPSRLTLLRYHILDECFVVKPQDETQILDKSEILYKPDLLEKINAHLKEAVPGVKPIAMRTLEKDIQDMQVIFGVQIMKKSLKKRAYYQYAKPEMTIQSGRLNGSERARLQGAMEILARYRGMPGFEWWSDAESLIRHRFGWLSTHHSMKKLVRTSPATDRGMEVMLSRGKGHQWLKQAVDALLDRRPIRLSMNTPDGRRTERHSLIVEWLVEQRQGWMVCALVWDEEAQESFRMVLELDSITGWDDLLAELPEGLIESSHWNWKMYIANRMELEPGLVVEPIREPDTLRIWFQESVAQGYLTEPFHSSQDMRVEQSGDGIIFQVHLVPDATFIRRMLSHGTAAQVLEPADLREQLAEEVRKMTKSYAKLFGP
ncbi:MAG: helix-turn-helix transcriptional regulator [Flavobacteriales bacterium]